MQKTFLEVLRKSEQFDYLRENSENMPYAQPTSCEIEGLFSTMKAKELNSRNFTCENLKNLLF